jgi:RNA polymerase sigma-70 factor (ECF subfamily)
VPTSEATVDQRSLVEQAQRGDHDAFAVLAAEAIARLDAAARLILRDGELARDAVQEALVRCWRDLPTLRDVERFDGWLHRLLVNACLDLVRRRRRRAIEVELTQLQVPTTADFSGGVADREQLDRALRALEPEWRAIVVLHFFLGMPMPEIAGILGIPLGTAKSRLHRALGVLRTTVGADGQPTHVAVPEGRFA